jgi:putative MATE family efflux protein
MWEVRLLSTVLSTIRRRSRDLLFAFPAILARLGIVDRQKGSEAFDLAVPVMVTGAMRVALRTADLLMVSLAIGDAAVAGLQLGFQYYFIAFGLSLALSSGTISVVSRFKGAGSDARADLAIKQSLWLTLAVALPLTGAAWVFAEPLIALLSDDPTVVGHGETYLRLVMLGVVFRFWGLVGARALAGGGDTRTPMYIRTISVPLNVVLNALLIFGVGPLPELGIAGAAIGTVLANLLSAGLFTGVLLSGRFVARLRLGGRQFDSDIISEILRVGTPLAGSRLADTGGRFPFLFVLGQLGTPVLAAYAIGRQVMQLAMMPAWGYSTASSTLVGQSLGAGDAAEATDYGWQTLRIGLVTQVLLAGVIVVAARPIAVAFGTEYVALTVRFIWVFGVGVAGFSIARAMRGALRGAGDTSWPFYGTLLGVYGVRVPIAALALPAGVLVIPLGGTALDVGLELGVIVVFGAIVGDFYARAVVNVARFWSKKWQRIGLSSADGTGAEDADAGDDG